MASTSMFSGANVHISGNATFQINEKGSESLDEGIRLLVRRVVRGAMHNSEERFDAPTCHQETRIALQDDILGWADELVEDLNELVTWLYGPAGSGKSAIAQTIAQKLHDRGQLTASFFFSRASGGGRGEETNFVATLSHQLSQNIPATKSYIAAAVRENPLVFDLALQDQVDALVVAPLIAVSNVSSGFEGPKVIVVDGLDECRQERDAQRRVVDALISGLRRVPHRTAHKLFITSRPEYKIVAIFEKYKDNLVRKMELNHTWNPYDDIRTFLNAGFADIRRSHFYFQGYRLDRMWPSSKDIEALVHKSSGQFIYPSVVMKYIKSEDNYNPVTRLAIILQLKNNEDQPYSELDAVYKHVFSQVRSVDRVITILSLSREYEYMTDWLPNLSTETVLSEFMGVHMDEIKFWLRPLSSLLVWRNKSTANASGITYMHASLLDFLLDQSRSDSLCINNPTISGGIVRRALKLIEDGIMSKTPDLVSYLLTITCRFADMLSSDQKFNIHWLIHDFDIVESVLCRIDRDLIDLNSHRAGLMRTLADYLRWVLAESEDESASHSRQALRKPVTRIQTWLINQFQNFRVDNLDNKEIDVWPFVAYSLGIHPIFIDLGGRTPTQQISNILSAAIAICGSLPSYQSQPLRGTTEMKLSHETMLLCGLISNLTPFLPDSLETAVDSWPVRPDLLGQHAITKERYRKALQHTSYYLLQLPKFILAELFIRGKYSKIIYETSTISLISRVLTALLCQSPLNADLYFLVVLTYPIIVRIIWDHNFWSVRFTIQKIQDKFPFLNAASSPEYIQERVKVEEACIQLKIKSSLHEMAHIIPADVWKDAPVNPVQWHKLLEEFAIIDRRVP